MKLIEVPRAQEGAGETDCLFLNKLTAYLELKFADPFFGVDELARAMAMSPAQLNRKLLRLTGYSSGKLINYCRLRVASDLLANGRQAVKHIAWKTGFPAHSTFCRSFTQAFRCSPTAYRERYRHANRHTLTHWKLPLTEGDCDRLADLATDLPWFRKLLETAVSDQVVDAISIDQLARSALLTPSSLGRKLKSLLDITPARFIRDVRLQYASELLGAKGSTIAGIAVRAGFFDHSHFCRCFKSAFGVAPTVFKSAEASRSSISRLKRILLIENVK